MTLDPLNADGELCARCGKPAVGDARIGDARYCHDGEDPTCYQEQSWEMAGAQEFDLGSVEIEAMGGGDGYG